VGEVGNIIPNAWIAHQIAADCVDILKQNHSVATIATNVVYIISELLLALQKQLDAKCENLFRTMLHKDEMRFVLLSSTGGFRLPKSIKTSGTPLPNPDSLLG
jgi:hypothetical protein